MTLEERWQKLYAEIVAYIKTNKRNPSKYDVEERGEYYTWLKHNRKVMNVGKMKEESLGRMFGCD